MGDDLSRSSLIEEVSELIKLTKELKICELTVEREGMKIHFRRPVSEELSSVLDAEGVLTLNEEELVNLTAVTSPMVGRFYRSVESDGEPLISVGQKVEKGQRLCIIESMKVPNDVLSEHEGIVISILVEDGQGVEYGQPLFEIDTSPLVEERVVEGENSHS